MEINLVCSEMTIAGVINQGATQTVVAQLYALALRSSYKTDWSVVNAHILKRWSMSGLDRIIRLAHSKKFFDFLREEQSA